MYTWTRMILVGLSVLLSTAGAFETAALADVKADQSKVGQGVKEVEKGGKQVGEGVADTAKGVGKTVVGGAEMTGEQFKAAGEAAKPAAKSAWSNVRAGAVSFGHSVKSFFSRLFSRPDSREGR